MKGRVGSGRPWQRLGVAFLVLVPILTFACGACDEDKIAATYDHRLVIAAAERGDAMVFCAVAGPFDRRRLVAAASGVRAIRVASVRTSNEPAAISFAVDLSRQSARAAVAALQRALPAGTRLTPLRIAGPPVS